jgi:hypothetical protein
MSEANRILVPGGRIVILDLVKHRFEEAREFYADEWLGFSETELESMLEKPGLTEIQTSVVHEEPEPPQVPNPPRRRQQANDGRSVTPSATWRKVRSTPGGIGVTYPAFVTETIVGERVGLSTTENCSC